MMTDEQIVAEVLVLQHAMRTGQLPEAEAAQRIARASLLVQGIRQPTAAQIAERLPEVIQALRFMDEAPTGAEVDVASSFISPVSEGDE